MLRFIETSLFATQIVEILSDLEYSRIQAALVLQPDLGDLVQGTGGLRKMRWGIPGHGRGKRGGIRVIYYWHVSQSVIYMVLVYAKSKQEDLSAEQKRTLRKIAEGLK